eukprot:6902414-Ditylum_brightwellii.AAC.1
MLQNNVRQRQSSRHGKGFTSNSITGARQFRNRIGTQQLRIAVGMTPTQCASNRCVQGGRSARGRAHGQSVQSTS